MWFLAWTAFALGHHHMPLFSTYLDYPAGVNLMWNTSVLLPGALLAPLTDRAGPVVSYNVLVTLAPAALLAGAPGRPAGGDHDGAFPGPPRRDRRSPDWSAAAVDAAVPSPADALRHHGAPDGVRVPVRRIDAGAVPGRPARGLAVAPGGRDRAGR